MYLQNKSRKNSISKLTLLAVLAAALGIWSDVVLAQDQVQAQTQIYGSQLMSDTERTEYQLKMRSLKTDKERAAFRLDHHEKMKVRAAEKGITLPTTPLGGGPGSKAGTGTGTGIGAGQGWPANSSGASKGAGK
jgi:hypothetical protein